MKCIMLAVLGLVLLVACRRGEDQAAQTSRMPEVVETVIPLAEGEETGEGGG